MKLVFLSNYLNHHSLELCKILDDECEGGFRFIATKDVSESRKKLGYTSYNEKCNFVIAAYKNEDTYREARQQCEDCDALIIGAAKDDYIIRRLKGGKLTFRYAERFYKEEISLKKLPRHFFGAWLHHGRFQKYPLYMLCASAYTAGDAARFGNYIGRCYKWGYFPEAKHYDLDELLKRKKAKVLLWAGRFIDWKHPEYAVRVAERLRQDGYEFEINMIGTGVMEEELRSMISEKQLVDVVHLLGAMTPGNVRMYMEEASIFLFTSDRQEGWGAVLNESMNSGCAVVACSAIGSVPFLLKNGENGSIYPEGDFETFYIRVKMLLEDAQLRERYGREAYQTIAETWCAEVAAKRLIKLTECLKNGEDTPFADGPCSKTKILKDGWFPST